MQKRILHHNVEHLHGPEKVAYNIDELIVLVVERNGRPYVRSFVEHYRSLGAKHLIFLDNGSTDGTVEALKKYEDVTVLRTTLPFKRYGICMRQYLVERFGRGRWTLNVDMDELFVYPYSDVVSLPALLGYLNDHAYTAVVANMLDMFPEKPLSGVPNTKDEPLKELHRFYDISNIRKQDYDLVGDIGNVLTNQEITLYRDGVRHTLFGTPTLLIKHPLIFLDDRLRPMDLSEHWVGNARIADFTGALLHYKLLDGLHEMVRREIEARAYPNRRGKYERYHEVLANSTNVLIKAETARELKSVNELVGNQFMVVSEQYMKFVGKEDSKRGNSAECHAERMSEAFFAAKAEMREQHRKAAAAQHRLKDALRKNEKLKQRVRELRERATKNRARVDSLQRQLDTIEASKTWRLLDILNRLTRKYMMRK